MAREFGQQQKKKRKQQQQQENNTNIYSNTLNKIVATNRNCIAWKVQQTLARRGTGFMASHSRSRSRSRSRIGVCSALSQLHLAAATLMGEQETGLPRWLATRLGAGSLLLLLLHVINDDAKRLGHNPLLCAYHNQMLPAPPSPTPSQLPCGCFCCCRCCTSRCSFALCLFARCDCTRRHSNENNYNNKSDNNQLHCRKQTGSGYARRMYTLLGCLYLLQDILSMAY